VDFGSGKKNTVHVKVVVEATHTQTDQISEAIDCLASF
jgi:hypothetical protein